MPYTGHDSRDAVTMCDSEVPEGEYNSLPNLFGYEWKHNSERTSNRRLYRGMRCTGIIRKSSRYKFCGVCFLHSFKNFRKTLLVLIIAFSLLFDSL